MSMIEDYVTPAVMSQQPVNRGEIDTRLPVCVDRGYGLDVHGRSLRRASG